MDPMQKAPKLETMTDSERFEEIRRLRLQKQATDARLADLSGSSISGNLSSSSLAAMAANGQYKCIEIDSDGEEIDTVVDGPKKTIDFTKIKVSVKTEVSEEHVNSIDRFNDTPDNLPKTKSRKRKTPISSEYVDVTFDSEYSSTNSDYSPGECLEFI